MITEADFQLWAEHPVTTWVFAGMLALAEAQKAEWIAASWDGGVTDPLLLRELATRADAYRAIPETNYALVCQANEQKPVAE